MDTNQVGNDFCQQLAISDNPVSPDDFHKKQKKNRIKGIPYSCQIPHPLDISTWQFEILVTAFKVIQFSKHFVMVSEYFLCLVDPYYGH